MNNLNQTDMNIKRAIFLIITLLAGAFLWPVSSWAEVAGSGTEQDPYKVYTWDDLYSLPHYNNEIIYIELEHDVSCEDQSQTLWFNKAVINLNNHTIDRGLGNQDARTEGYVLCANELTIIGPGIITGAHNTNNTSSRYGAVHGYSSLTLRGCTITGNKAIEYGGALFIASGNVTIEEETVISNNNAQYGGAIYIQGGTLTMNGGVIENNICGIQGEYGDGGAIYLTYLGNFTMNGGSIRNNSVLSSLNDYSGYGGGIYQNGGTFNMNGGIIEYNTCKEAMNGGGIYFTGEGAKINFSGTPIIQNNKIGSLETGALDNLFVNTNKRISITGSLNENAKIGVTLKTYGQLSNSIENSVDWDVSNIVPDAPCYFIYENEGCACCISYWSDLKNRIESCEDGATITLDHDHVAGSSDTQLIIPENKTITIDLNGYKIDRNMGSSPNSEGCSFFINGILKIKDSYTGNDRKHTIIVDDNPIEIKGGLITGGRCTNPPGAIYVYKGSFIMEGGTIAGNISTQTVGGVYVSSNAIFSMTGGSICYNTARDYGGVRFYGTFNVSGSATIINNKNTNGDEKNVYLTNGQVININEELTSTALIGVSMNTNGIFTTILGNLGTASNFKSDDAAYEPTLNSEGRLQLERRRIKYAIWDESNNKLYFTYCTDLLENGNSFTPEGGSSITINRVWSDDDVISNMSWGDVKSDVEEIIFESSFYAIELTSCSEWFKNCTNLTTITGLSNLNTSEVTDMSGMFQNCCKLGALTLDAYFSTTALTTYSNLFTGSSIANGTGTLIVKGATLPDDFLATITTGELEHRDGSGDYVSDNEVDKGSANAGLYTWKGGKFATYNGKALLTLGSTSNGSIAIASGATAISGGLYEAAPNTAITLSVTADDKYKLKTLTYNANDITNNSFDMPAGPVTVSATFTADFDPVDKTKDYDASTNPYAIRTREDLQKLSDYVKSGVEEVRDGYIKVVDVTELDFNGINDFVPIGTNTKPFTGSFDGNNVLIKNLKIDRGDEDFCGLFGKVLVGSNHNNKALQNIKIDASCEFKTTGSHVGALAGHRESIKVINCHNLGADVSGTSFVGAIIGGGVLVANDRGNTYDGSLVVATINGTKYWGCGYGVGGNQNTSSPSDYAQFTSTTIGGFYGAEGNEDKVTWRYDATTKTLLIKGTGSLASTTPWASYIGAATNNYTLNTDGIDLGTAVTQSDGYYVWLDKQFKYYDGRQQYKNTASVNEGGTMTVSPVYAEQGTTITLTPIAAVYSKLSSVNAYYKDDNGNQQAVILTSGADGTYTFTMPAYDISATATFGPVLSLADPSAACSRENPYLIRNVQDMVILSKATNGGASWTKRTYFKVAKANDVFDFEGIDFEPIGIATTHNVEPNERFNGNSFHSSFDGNGVTIRNLHISGVKGIGLFSELSANNDDYVENIFIDKSCSFTATNSYCGSIACNTSFTTVRNCHNLGAPVSASDIAGGIVGHARYATITDCSSNASVSGTQNIGGIVGYIDRLPVTLTNNMVGDGLKDGETITITGKKNTGAIVGLDIYRGASYSNNLYNGEAVIVIFNGKTLTGSGYGLGMKPSDTNGIGAMTQVLSYTQQQEWATYYQTFDLTLPEGFEAFYVSSVSISGETGTVMLTSTGQKIYKKLPMLIRKTGNSTTVELTKETHSGTAPKTDERFKGTATDISNLSAEGKIIYVLRDGMFIPAKAGAMAANRCWIEVSKSAGTRGLEIKVAGNPKEGFSQEEENLEDRFTQEVDSWFDLQGRPLQGKPSKKGMYIHNGRKEVIK